MDDPFGTAALRAAVLDAWAASPTRFREDANAEEDLRLGGYADTWFVELAQNAADAAGSAGRLRITLVEDGPAGTRPAAGSAAGSRSRPRRGRATAAKQAQNRPPLRRAHSDAGQARTPAAAPGTGGQGGGRRCGAGARRGGGAGARRGGGGQARGQRVQARR